MTVSWIDDSRFTADGVEFICSHGDSTVERFCIRKPRPLVEETLRRLARLRPVRVVELGIAQGGSVALTALVARPRMLIAFERDETPVAALGELIERASMQEHVRRHYGIDQADRDRIAAILRETLAGEALDLVVDDASHRFEETRISFETLFPMLRPGGHYVIEDWNWRQRLAFSLANRRKPREAPDDGSAFREYLRTNLPSQPLETLVRQLVLARACDGEHVGDLRIGAHSVVVERGPALVEPGMFKMADTFVDPQRIVPYS